MGGRVSRISYICENGNSVGTEVLLLWTLHDLHAETGIEQLVQKAEEIAKVPNCDRFNII